MRYARIENGEVKEIGEFPFIEGRFHPSLVWVECPAWVNERHLYSNGTFSIPPAPEPTQEEIKAQIRALDIKRIRPMAEGDTVYLQSLNDQIAALRAQLV